MPQVDMPLKELQNYQGISPRPADFDDFWERALEEMKPISRIELVPSRFQTPWLNALTFILPVLGMHVFM